jgi:C1A family cysteine protease
LIDPATKDFKKSCVHIKIMNSWAGEWGKQGYAWLPSEMLDWAEVAFPTQKQMDNFKQLIASNDIQASTVKFTKKKYRLSWEK